MKLTINELREKIAPIAKKWNVSTVYFFGSYARGEAGNLSDINLAIKIDDSHILRLMEFVSFSNEIEESLQKTNVASVEELQKEDKLYKKLLKEEFERDRVKLYEKSA